MALAFASCHASTLYGTSRPYGLDAPQPAALPAARLAMAAEDST